jgi:hypothetical protein
MPLTLPRHEPPRRHHRPEPHRPRVDQQHPPPRAVLGDVADLKVVIDPSAVISSAAGSIVVMPSILDET